MDFYSVLGIVAAAWLLISWAAAASKSNDHRSRIVPDRERDYPPHLPHGLR
jgi:hypothetical protein